MQLLNTVFLALGLAALSSALPHYEEDFAVDEFGTPDYNSLPEAGQLVFTPLEFGDSELEVPEFEFENITESSANFEDWKAYVVRTHNEYRRRYGAAPLAWSDALYPGTVQWARGCKFQHSNGGGKYGENLAAGTGSSYNYAIGLKDWMDEAPKYDYNRPGTSSGTGHFTQVVWKGSKNVACSVGDCPGGTIFKQASKYVVCRYDPPGNFRGRYGENVGRPQK